MIKSTIKPAPKIPKPVLHFCKILTDKNYKAWLAGGCVRDLILLRTPRDWDIVTNAPLEELKTLFPDFLDVGVAFGILKFPPQGPKAEPVLVDIAIFRKEEGYTDRRHPDKVDIGDESTDSARRDFTVNALYFDPQTNEVLDYTGGLKDLNAKTLRCVGDPATRFSEDALRILRAVRFSAQLGFKIEKMTSLAIKKCAHLLKDISRERVREEMIRLLESGKPVMGLEAIAQNGMWELVFGVRKVSIPADLRQLKLNWTPSFVQWLCAMSISGMLGDPLKDAQETLKKLTELLRLSNDEQRMLKLCQQVYDPQNMPLDWVELARSDKNMMFLLKTFVRRARGPTEEQKSEALSLVDQIARWAAKSGSEKTWPNAQNLIKAGIKEGPKLGIELKKQQWDYFWKNRP